MKPAAFAYVRPRSLDEAVSALGDYDGDAKVLAGGQSLVPLLNFRMLQPTALVDINRLPDLDYVVESGERGIRVGALTRHYTLETSPIVKERFPVLNAAMGHVAHLAVRNRGTLGGSLAHADPAAELPMMAMLLDAEISATGKGGARTLSAREFFVGPLTTALHADEILTDVSFPGLPAGTGCGFEEFAQRSGDFAIAAAAALVSLTDGKASLTRIALMGVDETSVRADEAEEMLIGQRYAPDRIRAAVDSACGAVNPSTDQRASADYRRHLVSVLTQRALTAAWRRAGGRLS